MDSFDPVVLLMDAVEVVHSATNELLKVSSHWWQLVPPDPTDGHSDAEWSLPRVEVEPQMALLEIRKAGQLFDAKTRDVRDNARYYRDWAIKWVGGRLPTAEVREELSKPLEYIDVLVALSHTVCHRLGDFSREITHGAVEALWTDADLIMLRFRDVIQSLRDFQPRAAYAREDRAATAVRDADWLRTEINAVAVGLAEESRVRLFERKHDYPFGLNSTVINGLVGKPVIEVERRSDNGFWADYLVIHHKDESQAELAWLVRHEANFNELNSKGLSDAKVRRTIDYLVSWQPDIKPSKSKGKTIRKANPRGRFAYKLLCDQHLTQKKALADFNREAKAKGWDPVGTEAGLKAVANSFARAADKLPLNKRK